MEKESIITVKNLTKRFGAFTAVDQITFEVRRGEIFGFLGANGAGKTTAMRMLSGLLTPTSGEASILGLDVFKNPEKVKKCIGYMSQRFSLYDALTVAENIRFYGGIYGLRGKQLEETARQMIQQLGLQDQAETLVRDLPLGWKQKLAFLVAIQHQPQVVFLDEPTGGVDPVTRRQFWELIYATAAQGITLFVTTHYMDEAEYCDRVCIMVDGRIAALDTPGALRERYRQEDMQGVFYQLARQAHRQE